MSAMKARLSADMMVAARKGDWRNVERLVQLRADVNSYGAHKISPLMLAVRKDEPKMCEMLLVGRAAVDARDGLQHQHTALMYASISVGSRALEVLQVLLRNAASIDVRDTSGCTSLMIAANLGNLDSVRLLLESAADVHAIAHSEGLNERAMGFPRKAVRRFLENSSGQPINAVDAYMVAQRRLAKEAEEAARQELAKLGSEMTFFVSDPDMYINGTSEVIDEHITESKAVETLEEATIDEERYSEDESEDEDYEDLTYAGYLPNGMFLSKVAPLRPRDLAKQPLPAETQQKLMAQSEKIRSIKRCPAGSGDSALTVAARSGHAEVCELLLEYRADCNAADGNGDTPLYLAASGGHIKACRVFLCREILPQAHANALRIAEQSCREDVVRLLRGYT